MSLPERQAELVETHRAIQDANLPYVLVGGWAITAYQTRFTTDVDVVLPSTALDDYDSLLTRLDYVKTSDSDVSNVYEGRIVCYEKAVGDHTVEFDALVDALRCRQTNAEWSYRHLAEHSVTESLNVAPDLTAKIPEPALLFALKLHSGRRADARDLVVIGTEADFDRVEHHLHRGDLTNLEGQIERVLGQLTSDGFEDSFKGVFRQEQLPEPDLEAVTRFLRRQLDGGLTS